MIFFKAAQAYEDAEKEYEYTPLPSYPGIEQSSTLLEPPELIDVDFDVERLASSTTPTRRRRRRCLTYRITACTVILVATVHFLVTSGIFGSNKLISDECGALAIWRPSQDRPDEFPFHRQASFSVPLDASELSFLSQGALQFGEFRIVQDLDPNSDWAIVDLHASYAHSKALNDAAVCALQATDGTEGIGILTTSWRNPYVSRSLKFYVTLRLPASSPHSPLKINRLTTNMPLFSHHLPELGDSVYFEQITLNSDNSPLRVDSLSGNGIRLQTANAAIYGKFHASTYLALGTSNAAINVLANLTNGDGPLSTILALQTSNAAITGEIALRSNATDSTKGRFYIDAQTSNAPLTLSIVDAPVDSTVNMKAVTSHAPAVVTMHPTYEGTFDLSSSTFFRPEVMWVPVDDPAGRGRRRHVDIFSQDGSSQVRGAMSWGSERSERGTISVQTSISTLRLQFKESRKL